MICGYNNIQSLCLSDKYSYQFLETAIVSGIVTNRSDDQAPVIRIDNETQDRLILYPYSKDVILPCDITDDSEIVSCWECYKIWKSLPEHIPDDAPVEAFKEKQKQLIETYYASQLEQGFSTTINDQDVVLSRDPASQSLVTSSLLRSNIDFTVKGQNTAPTIISADGTVIQTQFIDSIDTLELFNSNNIELEKQTNQLLNQISEATNINEIIINTDSQISSSISPPVTEGDGYYFVVSSINSYLIP